MIVPQNKIDVAAALTEVFTHVPSAESPRELFARIRIPVTRELCIRAGQTRAGVVTEAAGVTEAETMYRGAASRVGLQTALRKVFPAPSVEVILREDLAPQEAEQDRPSGRLPKRLSVYVPGVFTLCATYLVPDETSVLRHPQYPVGSAGFINGNGAVDAAVSRAFGDWASVLHKAWLVTAMQAEVDWAPNEGGHRVRASVTGVSRRIVSGALTYVSSFECSRELQGHHYQQTSNGQFYASQSGIFDTSIRDQLVSDRPRWSSGSFEVVSMSEGLLVARRASGERGAGIVAELLMMGPEGKARVVRV